MLDLRLLKLIINKHFQFRDGYLSSMLFIKNVMCDDGKLTFSDSAPTKHKNQLSAFLFRFFFFFSLYTNIIINFRFLPLCIVFFFFFRSIVIESKKSTPCCNKSSHDAVHVYHRLPGTKTTKLTTKSTKR